MLEEVDTIGSYKKLLKLDNAPDYEITKIIKAVYEVRRKYSGEGVVWMKWLPSVISESWFYFGDEYSKDDMYSQFGVTCEPPCYIKMSLVSKIVYGDSDLSYLRSVERKGFFVSSDYLSNNRGNNQKVKEPPVSIDGLHFSCLEAYYQLQKTSPNTRERDDAHNLLCMTRAARDNSIVQVANNPLEALKIGRNLKLRGDWEDLKDGFMKKGLRAKFGNLSMKSFLMGTGNHRLVIIDPNDDYWASGKFGDGKNMICEYIMNLRKEYGNQP